MTGAVLQPDFLEGTAGRLFITCFQPPGGTDRWVLFLPPFAEELNKSRRMIARFGYQLAEQGIGLCLPDLYGTGDSEGDFGGASLSTWEQDLRIVTNWLGERHGCQQLACAGLRYGALQAMALQDDIPGLVGCLLWQPVHKGQQQLTQFLRLRQASALIDGTAGQGLKEMQARLSAGESLEVAGYMLSPALAEGLAAMELASSPPRSGRKLAWLEVSSRPEPALMPVSQQLLEQWRAQGCEIQAEVVSGDSFWQTQELVDVPQLLDASTRIVLEWLPA